MNICLVTPLFATQNLTNSGIGNHFFELANGLTNLNHKIHVLFLVESDTEIEMLRQNNHNKNLRFYPIKIQLPWLIKKIFYKRWAQYLLLKKIWSSWQVSKVLNRINKEQQIDVIETTSYDFLCLKYILNKKRPPIITRVSTTAKQIERDHNHFVSRAMQLVSWLEYWTIKKSDFLITHTLNHRNEICQDFGIETQRFTIIPHGIKLPEKSSLNYNQNSNEKINILYVGRFEYRKGIDVLLEAIPPVLKLFNNVVFNLVGKDEQNNYQNNFQAQWNNQWRDRVHFMGNVDVDQLHQMYRECDLFVAPSRYESFGLIYVEAMSYGKPVIGCKVGGVPEVIEDKVTGLLVQPNNSHDLVDKLHQLIVNDDLRIQMGRQARKRVETFFSREVMAKMTLNNYRNIIG